MIELTKGLKRENERLKKALVAAQSRMHRLEKLSEAPSNTSAASSKTRSRIPAVPPVAMPRGLLRYTVQSGDTLSRISEKVYGTPSRWKDIYQANRARLSSENALQVGQELQIPQT